MTVPQSACNGQKYFHFFFVFLENKKITRILAFKLFPVLLTLYIFLNIKGAQIFMVYY
jgi:hypothetical protein